MQEWLKAIANEMKSILKNDTWMLVDRPSTEQIIGSRIVLRNKHKADGSFEKRKARLVAQGCSQIPGTHFYETFAPVARMTTVRLIVALAAHLGLSLQQLDVSTAYLNGEIQETWSLQNS